MQSEAHKEIYMKPSHSGDPTEKTNQKGLGRKGCQIPEARGREQRDRGFPSRGLLEGFPGAGRDRPETAASRSTRAPFQVLEGSRAAQGRDRNENTSIPLPLPLCLSLMWC